MSRRWHTPRWYAWLLLALGLALFVSLGRWQLDRAAQKEALLASYAAASAAAPRPFATVAAIDADSLEYPRVRVRGRYVAERSYLLDEQPMHGRIGVMALALFQSLEGTRRLLVNRGWVEWNHAPGSAAPVPPLPTGELELTGVYAPPPGGGLRVGGDALARQDAWPKLTLFVDLAALARDAGSDLYPRVLLLDAEPGGAFVREWTPALMPPARHRGYAFQWFALAAAILVVFVVVHRRKPAPGNRP